MNTIINIGRQYGSGGHRIAEVLGSRLGIPVYDSELLTKAAEESGFSKDIFLKKDEKKGFLSNLVDVSRFGSPKNYMSDSEVFKMQSDVIRKIASEGSAIFVGRASDYVLRDMECLDVFICAPVEDRVKNVEAREQHPDVRAFVEKKDKEREAFYNFFTFSEWGVASNYDLCVDSSILGIEGTADFIIEFGKAAGLIR